MKRRDFFKSSLLASVAPVMSMGRENSPFELKYAPHFGMFEETAGKDPADQLRFGAEVGFRAWEDNGMKGRSVEEQETIGRELERLGLQMGVFVAHDVPWNDSLFATGDTDYRSRFLNEIKENVDIAARVNARWMTVVPGQYDRQLAWDYQTANVIETLKQAAAILEPHGLVMVLESLNPYRDHPGMFLSKIPQAYMICKAVASPSCKILFDLYHQQITEGNLIPNIDRAWEEIGYFQTGDNPGRNEPTTGEINYQNVFRHLKEKKWDGILGMEHGKSKPGKEGEQAVIEAYREVDG